MELDDTVCYCFHVSKRKILNFLRVHRPRKPSGLSECGGAGTGCGWCVRSLQRYFEAAQANLPPTDLLTPEEYAAQREIYLTQKKTEQEKPPADPDSSPDGPEKSSGEH